MAESLTAAFSDVLSPNISWLSESATLAVAARARALRAEGIPVIDLGAGEPDADTPEFIRRAAKRAIDEGATRYTMSSGILPLRQAIAQEACERLASHGGGVVEPDQVVVSTGSKQSLFNACFSLFGPEDEVLVPTPGWTSYYEIVRLARATPVPVMGDPAIQLRVTVDSLTSAATPRTRGLILNSPCNPTGAIYDAQELAAIVGLAEERGWWILSDEIYQRLAYEESAPSLLDIVDWPSQLVVINGVAKAYAMTGWRIGWAMAPRPIARAMTALQSHVTSNAATVSQHAALAALTQRTEADASIGELVAELTSRRDAALAELACEPRIKVAKPQGAFYLFLDVSAVGNGAEPAGTRFARELMDRSQVAVVPGAAFLTPDWVRVSYSANQQTVVEGVRRLIGTFRELLSEA